MGRKKKHQTDKDRKEANRISAHKYYLKNAGHIRRKRMEKYYDQMATKMPKS